VRDQRAPSPFFSALVALATAICTRPLFFSQTRGVDQTRQVCMLHSDFFGHACERPFSETLTPAENDEGKVVWPHHYRTPGPLYDSPEAPALRGKSVGMHSALLITRRQYYFVASLPADEQHAVSRLYSGSGVDAKSTVKRVAVQARRCAS